MFHISSLGAGVAIHLENFKEGTPEELEVFRDVWHAPVECSANEFTLWIQRRGAGEKLGVGGGGSGWGGGGIHITRCCSNQNRFGLAHAISKGHSLSESLPLGKLPSPGLAPGA